MPEVRWLEIADSIRNKIESGKLKPGDKVAPESELVVQWGVSRMTVHRAMQELQREGLVERSRGRGTIVAEPKTRATGRIGLLFQHTENMFEVGYLIGIREALNDQYQLLFSSTEDDAEREAQYLTQMQNEADGIILFPTAESENTPLLKSIIDSGTPVVCLDRIPDGLEADAVVTDNYKSSLEALRSLLEHGHQRIAYVGDRNLHVSAARERYEAYLQAMGEAGEPDPERYVRWFPPAPEWDFVVQATHDALYRMLREPDPPTAVFCVHDFYLAAVLEACERMELSVPDDLEMLSFCDYPSWTLRGSTGVNRIVQQTRLIGENAAHRMQKLLEERTNSRELVRIPALFYPAENSRSAVPAK